MRIQTLLCAATTLAVLSAAGLAHGQDIIFAQDQDAVQTPAQGPVGADVLAPVEGVGDCCCECCPWYGAEIFTGINSFHGQPEGDRHEKFGYTLGGNFGFALWQDWGLGAQVGGSWDVYDWKGRTNGNTEAAAHYAYTTIGVFQNCDPCCGRNWSWGVAYDYLSAEKFGHRGLPNVDLSQWRAQVAYAWDSCNEFGITAHWTADGDRAANLPGGGNFDFHTLETVNHYDIFWHRALCNGTHLRLWCGIVEDDRLPDSSNPANGMGSLLDFLIGARIQTPITCSIDVYGSVEWGNPSAGSGDFQGGPRDRFSSVALGLVYYPGRSERDCTVCRNCYMPYLPVANPTNFIVNEGRVGGDID